MLDISVILVLFNQRKLKVAAKQLTNHYNFHVLKTNHITTKLTNPNQDQRHKYHHLMMTLHLTLKMTTAQVVETSVTNNSLSKDYPHPDDHAKQITDTPGYRYPWVQIPLGTDTPGFKPFTSKLKMVLFLTFRWLTLRTWCSWTVEL